MKDSGRLLWGGRKNIYLERVERKLRLVSKLIFIDNNRFWFYLDLDVEIIFLIGHAY